MALDDLLSRMETRTTDTPDTSCNPPEVSAKPAPNKACTLDTPDTSQIINADDEARIARWLLRFVQADELTVIFVPPATHGKALAYYPDAVAAEPIPERPQRMATKAEAREITALIQAIFPDDTEVDRGEALAAALADPEGALHCYRTIAKERGLLLLRNDAGAVKTCPACRHFARPSRSEGYCSGRDELPAYGANHPLRRLPADRGASCEQWQAGE